MVRWEWYRKTQLDVENSMRIVKGEDDMIEGFTTRNTITFPLFCSLVYPAVLERRYF